LRGWHEKHGLGALPRFWQRLRIDAGWETAVESVLRERLHAVEMADAAGLSAVLDDHPPAKTSVFEPAQDPAAGPAVSAAQGLAPLASKIHVAGDDLSGALADWLTGVFACEGNPDQVVRAALAPGAILVNRQGDQFTRHTVSFHAPDGSDEEGVLLRQAQIEDLQKRCEELGEQMARAQARLAEAEATAADRTAALEAARQDVADRQKAHHDAQIDQLKHAQAEERYRERSAKLRAELAEVEAELEAGTRALARCEESMAVLQSAIADARAALDEVRTGHVAAETALAEQRRAVQQAERDAQNAVFGERECSSKIGEIDHSVRVIDQQIVRADAEIAKLTEELAADPIPEVRQALDAAVEARIACEKTLAEARNAVEAAAATLRELEEAKLGIDSRVEPLRERLGELRLKEQAAGLNAEQFAGQLREANADEALLEKAAEDAPRPSSLQGEITRLTQAIAELGAVNLAALEELGTSKERKGFLDSQAMDLEEAVRTLEDAIRKIDRETRELLRETFESVNRHFGSLFPALFGGGEAKLVMTGEEILDAGVQVMAHPPGKRNASIHLLSGGEKALTAISLVFSLFQLNPAPFCLLDEVDAPLDDSNTQRFCDLVKRMSAQTQFLFISHNKISMEMAEQLVGVTMPESGVSRVVAVDIDQALRIREELAA
jgi:chromosome segregation protein